MKTIKHLLLLSLLLSQPALAKERCVNACSFGVFPYTNPTQIRHTYSPIVEDISFTLDLDVHLTTTNNLSKFISKLKSESYDIALTGPIAYAQIAHETNYRLLAKPDRSLSFYIVSLEGLGINETKDLIGKTVGKRIADSGAWFSTEALLIKAGIYNRVKLLSVNSDSDCFYKLAANIVAACGVSSPAFASFKESMPMDFKIIDRIGSFPSSVYLVHKDVSEKNQKLLNNYLLDRDGLIEAKHADYIEIIKMVQK